MLKLSPKHVHALMDASRDISAMFDDLEALRAKFEEDAQAILDQISEAKEAAREIMDDAASMADEYHDDKSEKWQEGDRGQAYGEWRDRLREIADALAEDVEGPEVTMPETPEWVNDLEDCDFSEFQAP
jgi:hypothetical protein